MTQNARADGRAQGKSKGPAEPMAAPAAKGSFDSAQDDNSEIARKLRTIRART